MNAEQEYATRHRDQALAIWRHKKFSPELRHHAFEQYSHFNRRLSAIENKLSEEESRKSYACLLCKQKSDLWRDRGGYLCLSCREICYGE